ncbi:MAG: hypothetical protein ABMA01_13145 [Chthoniobacteraceae bacterium]
MQRRSITSDDGIHALPPGTPVRLVRKTENSLLVTDGRREFEAQTTDLTNDLDLAARVAMIDSQQRSGLAASQRAEAEAAFRWQQHQDAAAVRETAAATKLQQLQGAYDALIYEEKALTEQISQARQAESREKFLSATKTAIYSKSPLVEKRAAWEARLAQIREQKSRIRTEISRSKR